MAQETISYDPDEMIKGDHITPSPFADHYQLVTDHRRSLNELTDDPKEHMGIFPTITWIRNDNGTIYEAGVEKLVDCVTDGQIAVVEFGNNHAVLFDPHIRNDVAVARHETPVEHAGNIARYREVGTLLTFPIFETIVDQDRIHPAYRGKNLQKLIPVLEGIAFVRFPVNSFRDQLGYPLINERDQIQGFLVTDDEPITNAFLDRQMLVAVRSTNREGYLEATLPIDALNQATDIGASLYVATNPSRLMRTEHPKDACTHSYAIIDITWFGNWGNPIIIIRRMGNLTLDTLKKHIQAHLPEAYVVYFPDKAERTDRPRYHSQKRGKQIRDDILRALYR